MEEVKNGAAASAAEIQEKAYQVYAARIKELEEGLSFTSEIFEKGKASSERYGTIILDQTQEAARVVVSLYSTAAAMTGSVKAMAIRCETKRKYAEACLYIEAKKALLDGGRDKPPQKEIEAVAAKQNKERVDDEMKWDMLLSRYSACKDAFAEQLRTLNLLTQIRTTELRYLN